MSRHVIGPDPAFEADLTSERRRADAGDLEGAIAALEVLWRQAHAHHPGNELRALSTLSTALGRAGRFMEALVLSRHHAALSCQHGDATSELVAWGNVASALSCLGAAEATRRTLPTLEELSRRATGAAAARGWSEYYEAATALALLARDPDAMEVAIRAYADVAQEGYGHDDATSNWVIGMNTAELALLRRDPGTATARLDRLLTAGHARVDQAPEISCLRARIALTEPHSSQCRAAVEAALTRLEGLGQTRAGLARRIPLATEFARVLEGHPRFASERGRLHEIAAEAIVYRMGQLEDAYARYQGLGVLPDADDAVSIGLLRLDFARQHADLLDAVARHLVTHTDVLHERLLQRGPGKVSILVCAWCRQLCTRQGNWIPIAHFLPRSEIQQVTHGICPTCHARQEL